MTKRDTDRGISGARGIVWPVLSAVLAVLILGAPQAYTQRIITTVAGNGSGGFAGGGPATHASLRLGGYGGRAAVDAAGNLYIADTGNNRIRGVSASSAHPDARTQANSHLTDGDVRALVVDPSDPNTLYTGTGSHGVFKSTDAGADWLQSGLQDTEVNVLAVDPRHAKTLYAGTTGRGLLRTTDAGDTWGSAGPDIPNVNLLTMDPRDSSALLAGDCGSADSCVLFRSADGGESWNQIPFPSNWTQFAAIDPVNPNVIYLIDHGLWGMDDAGSLWKSIDGGKYWDRRSLHDNGLRHLVVNPAKPGILYGYDGYAYWKSTDGATTWTPFTLPIDTITADPIDAATLYTIARGGLYRSTDGGDTWSNLIGGLPGVAQALAVSGSNPPMLFIGTHTDGVLRYGSMLTLDRSGYCLGGSWQVTIANAAASAPIRLVGISNGKAWDWPGWGTTDDDGTYSASGTFGDGSQGSHSLYVEIGGITSNVVSLTISDCKQETYQPHLEIVPSPAPDGFCPQGVKWILRLTNGPPDVPARLVGDAAGVPLGMRLAEGAKADAQGNFSAAGQVTRPAGKYSLSVEVGGLRSNTVPVEIVPDCMLPAIVSIPYTITAMIHPPPREFALKSWDADEKEKDAAFLCGHCGGILS